MREIKIEDYLRKRVKATGGYCRKVVFPGYRGAPDRLIGWPVGVHGSCHLFVELKRPGGPVAEAHQRREHERLRSVGFIVEVAHTKDDVDNIIARHGSKIV